MRESLLKILVVAAFLVLGAKLITAQIFAGAYYRSLAGNNRIRQIPIHAPRGLIFDRNGNELVSNLPAFSFDRQIVSKDQAISLETEGKLVEIDSVRSYLYGPVFAHVLSGVEQKYQEKLRGKNGMEIIEVDATGKKLRTLAVKNPVPGENLTLTLDKDLQKTAYEEIKNKSGAIVITNSQTGAILTLVSSPSFEPEKLANYLKSSDQPLFNRAISGTYPPGSTFKIITALAGLESGKITENTTIDDPGILIIGEYKFPNWLYLRNGGTQGVLNVVSALQKSNDIFFYRTGEWTGFENLTVWAKKFSLGHVLAIDLPGEAAGNWPEKVPFLGDLYHLAIGQGDLLVTPLQVNSWTAVIANGGKLCPPYLFQKSACQDLKISKKALELVKEGMTAACSAGGTAYPLFGMNLACKTGTAEFGTEGKTHAWLTAFTKDISITVLVEGGGEGSDAAAPIVKKILEKWFEK